MKSVVVEIKGRFAAVLSDDGSMKKIKNKDYAVGQEVQIIENTFSNKRPGIHIRQKKDGMKLNSLLTKVSIMYSMCGGHVIMFRCRDMGLCSSIFLCQSGCESFD